MAGLILTAGATALADHKKCFNAFTQTKDLNMSHQKLEPSFCLTKFCRQNENDDNILNTDDLNIWGIGTIIYKDYIGKEALAKFELDLREYPIDKLVQNLDGPFGLVVKRPGESGLWIITDHAGILNLYKYQTGNTIAICSSALALSRSFPVNPSTEGILQFLRLASISDSKTIYNEIELLEAGSIFFIECEPETKMKMANRYWKSPIDINDKIDFQEARDYLADSLLNRFEIFNNGNIISDLTGGFDSRLIVSAILSTSIADNRRVHTFVFGPEESNDAILANRIADAAGLKHRHLKLSSEWRDQFFDYVVRAFHITDGEENICNYAPILFANEVKRYNHDWALNGLGGELYRDFYWMQEIWCRRRKANYERLIDTRILQYEFDYSIFSDKWQREILQIKNILNKRYVETNSDMDLASSYNTLQCDNIYFRQKIRRWAGRTTSSSNQLIRVMSPLTSKKCLEFAMSIHPKYKRNGKLIRAIIEKFSPMLSEHKMLTGIPCQNLRLGNIYKFSPLITGFARKSIRKLFQKTLNKTILLDKTLYYDTLPWYAKMLSDDRCRKILSYDAMHTAKIFDKDRFLKFIENAQKPGFPYYHQLGNILTLEMKIQKDKVVGWE